MLLLSTRPLPPPPPPPHLLSLLHPPSPSPPHPFPLLTHTHTHTHTHTNTHTYWPHTITRNKSAETLTLAGSVGVYLLQFCEFTGPHRFKLKGLLMDLMLAMESLQAYIHTTDTINALEAEIVRVLAGLEILLPLHWNTHVRHVLLHLCENIRRCGPFFTHNMLTFERWHTAFKKCVRCGSGHHVMAGVRNTFAMMWSANMWTCKSQGGSQWHKSVRRSTISGRRAWCPHALACAYTHSRMHASLAGPAAAHTY